MGQGVSSEVAVASELFPAVRTVVWLDVGVGEEVSLEVGSLVEGATACVALVRRVLHVEDAMHCQRPRLTEPFATLAALERLLLRVDVPVVCTFEKTAPSGDGVETRSGESREETEERKERERSC